MDQKERMEELLRLFYGMKRQWLRLYTVEADGKKIEWIQ